MCDADMQPILRRESGTFRRVNLSLVRTVHRTALVSSCAPDVVHDQLSLREAERGSNNEDFQNNRRHIHRTTKRGPGSKQNTFVISSRSTRRDVGSGHGTDTWGVGVRSRGHGAESERVILVTQAGTGSSEVQRRNEDAREQRVMGDDENDDR